MKRGKKARTASLKDFEKNYPRSSTKHVLITTCCLNES